MIKCKAVEAAKRLEALQIHKVVGAGKKCLPKLVQIRQHSKKFQLTAIEEEKIYRLAELIGISLDIPYEVESLLLIAEIDIIADLISSVKKSVGLLKELDEDIIECEESDNDFYIQFSTYCINRT